MAKKKYTVGSPEGAQFAGIGVAVGDEVHMELPDEQELALLAAGWLEEPKKAGKSGTEGGGQ